MRKYYGKHIEKAKNNFPFSFRLTPKEFIYTIVEIKKAGAIAHFKARELSVQRKDAIVKACNEILKGKHDGEFVLPAFQGGAGTSNHMNVNEVIAGRATEILKGKIVVHPNDHVNLSHSTNDVMPSALKITAYRLSKKLLGALVELENTLAKKAKEFKDVQKLGRTHMQDAVPMTLGDEFSAYEDSMKRGRAKIERAMAGMLMLNLGGSAVGNGVNVSKKYFSLLYKELRAITKIPVEPAKNLIAQTSSHTDILSLSQALTALCVDLSKIANDFKLLSSGPKGGFAEIILPELQAGSSIMPGKVNPILPEAMNQLYFLVSGNNLTIEKAVEGAQLEMSVMTPVMTDRMVESLKLSEEMIRQFTNKCVSGIRANKKQIKWYLENSTAYATCLTPRLGYDTVASAVKESLKNGKTLREIILQKKLLTGKEFDKLIKKKI